MMVLFAYLGLCVCIFSVRAWSPTNRLQRDAIPKSYSLKLVPNLKNYTFKGEVTILIGIQHSVKNITLNSRNLVINEASLDQSIGRTEHKLSKSLELLHVSYNDQEYINPGEHILNFKFEGSLQNMLGFYAYSFKENGKTRTIIATKFSSIHARTAFPCFDEPYFRSIFNIRLVKPDNTWTALSNMKQIASYNTPEGIAVDFQSTLPISTYLLAWVLTDYSYDEIKYKRQGGGDDIPLRFFTSEARCDDRKKLLDTTASALEFYENYTDIKYPLPKLDSIEIPGYRSMGMEHWGLIAYREDGVTYNPAYSISPLESYVDAALLIAHEVAHMWFGDLVTHEWYNDIWLTEGFARYMQFKAVSHIFKNPIISMFHNKRLIYLQDTHCSNHLAGETVKFPSDLGSISLQFMSTTYEQGAAVLMMLESVMGPEKFQNAVRIHLKKNQYGISTTGNFMNTIQNEVPDVNVRGLMETYLFQKKFPSIYVNETSDGYVLTQKPICGNETSIFGNRWTIPIKYISSSNRTSRLVWFDREMNKLQIPKNRNDRWIKINHLNQGLYRTEYADSILREIEKNFHELQPDDQGSLLYDTFILASSRDISCSVPVRLLGNLRNDTNPNFTTFNYALRAIRYFARKLSFTDEIRRLFYSYVFHVLEPIQQKVGWVVGPQEMILQRLLRVQFLDFICMDIDYRLCTKDMEKFKKDSIPHEDLEYIFKAIPEKIKLEEAEKTRQQKNISKQSNTTEINENSTLKNVTENVEDECSAWIRENIPKIIEQFNQI